MNGVELLATGWFALLIGYLGWVLLATGRTAAEEAQEHRRRRNG